MKRSTRRARILLSGLLLLACAFWVAAAQAKQMNFKGTLTVNISQTPGVVNPPAQSYTITGSGVASVAPGGTIVLPAGALSGVSRNGPFLTTGGTFFPGFPLQSFSFGTSGSPVKLGGSFAPGGGWLGGFGGSAPAGGLGRGFVNLGPPTPTPATAPGSCYGTATVPLSPLGKSVTMSWIRVLYGTGCTAGGTLSATTLTIFPTARGRKWTTGPVMVATTVLSPPGQGVASATGYDNRTAQGAGMIQLVTPQLITPSALSQQAGVGVLKLHFTPIPATPSMTAWGISALALSLCAGGVGATRRFRARRE